MVGRKVWSIFLFFSHDDAAHRPPPHGGRTTRDFRSSRQAPSRSPPTPSGFCATHPPDYPRSTPSVTIGDETQERSELKACLFFLSSRDTGKGLGKDENGITEPVRLATSQNKAGVGYDETKGTWWEKLFNDATKNIKVESHNNEVSLSVVDDTDPSRFERTVLSNRHTRQKFVGPESTKTCQLAFDPELNAVCSGKTTGRNLTSGKLERIAEQDRILLNKSQLYTSSKSDMAYRKANAESDVEENEHEIDNNKSMLRSEEGDGFVTHSKSTKKKHRKRINKLAEKLGTCNLGNFEEISNQSIRSLDIKDGNSTLSSISIATKVSDTSHTDSNCGEDYGSHNGGRRRRSNVEENYIKHYLNNKKLCQKMKKSKEKSMDSSTMLNCLKNSTVNKLDLKPFTVTIYEDVNTNVHNSIDNYNRMQVKTLYNTKKNFIGQFKTIPRIKFENEEEEWYKVVVGPDLNRRRADKQSKKCTCDVEEEIRPRNNYCDLVVPICNSKQDIPKPKNIRKLRIINSLQEKRNVLSHIDEEMREYYIRRLNDKIQKKKEQRFRSKLKKITEKLRGEALANELNSVIKNLTAFDLTDKVNANTIKKKSSTQTHLTPV